MAAFAGSLKALMALPRYGRGDEVAALESGGGGNRTPDDEEQH
jgi:hypothetical protein